MEKGYIKVSIENVSLSKLGFVVFLREASNPKVLPIFIGAAEAHSIAATLNHQQFPRPLSHDLFKSILESLGSGIDKIHINSLMDQTFYASVFVRRDDELVEIDSRPSDAIALALRYKSEIFVHREVLNAACVDVANEDEEGYEGEEPSLKDKMQKAVEEERYEDAAKIRDQIQEENSGN